MIYDNSVNSKKLVRSDSNENFILKNIITSIIFRKFQIKKKNVPSYIRHD